MCDNRSVEQRHQEVQDFYGKRLPDGQEEIPAAVCPLGQMKMLKHVRDAINSVHPDVTKRYYGCGLVIPECLEGRNVLDLGSGAGQDCFSLSKLVGQKGHVTGVDMTPEQIDFARQYVDYHTEKYGYSAPNMDFVQGFIESMDEAGIKENFYDIIVSNCVVCLSTSKHDVLKQAFRALKEGGEMFFSDMYANKRVPDNLKTDPVLWGEGYGGALWWKDLHTLAEEIGFSAPRLVRAAEFKVTQQEHINVLGDMKYVAATYRLFKLPASKQTMSAVTYDGHVTGCDQQISLDHNTTFKAGCPRVVTPEVATILKASRLSSHFAFCAADDQVIASDPFEVALGGPAAPCCK